MGNDVKSRLHLKKGSHKHDQPEQKSGPVPNPHDETIMKSSNRARDVDINVPSGPEPAAPTRGEPPTRGEMAVSRDPTAPTSRRS